MKILIGGVIVILVIGGGYWYWTSTQSPTYTAPADTAQVVPEDTQTVSVTEYSLADVATHPDRTSCWTAINGNVYDVTAWIERHPGGAERILSICGKDGSSAFSKKHFGEPKPETMLASFKIGILK